MEKWFNDTMDRVSGWYKRRTQYCLLLIDLAICYAGNTNTIGITLWLWNGDAARNAVLAAATDDEKGTLPPQSKIARQLNDAPSRAATTASAQAPLTDLATNVVDVDRQLTALQYPIG